LQDVRQQMDELDITDITHIVEGLPLEQLPDYLALSDVATLPRTDCPGHPVKILNYMGGNLAIVGFTGAAKGLHHMKNSYLAEDHNVQQFAEGIELLFSRPHIAEQLANQARRTLELYEWKVLCKGIALIYEMLRTKDFETKKPQLNHYIKSSYHPKFWDQRDGQSNEADEKFQELRIHMRRKSFQRIDFIERRKVIDAE
jgi:1,2-diacylglycerol 3-alpha-glucosyltransferase